MKFAFFITIFLFFTLYATKLVSIFSYPLPLGAIQTKHPSCKTALVVLFRSLNYNSILQKKPTFTFLPHH